MKKRKTIIVIIVLVALFGIYNGSYSDIPIENLGSYINSESKFFHYENMKIHYRDEGTGRVVFLIHGTGASLHTWDYWVENLKGSCRVVRLDLPGFGITGPNPNHNYSIEEYVKIVDGLVRHLKLKNMVMAGNSLGGAVAWNYTYSHQNRVAKLVLLDAAAFRSGTGINLFEIAKNPVTSFIGKYFTPKILIRTALKQVYFDDSKVDDKLVNYYHEMLLRKGNREAMIDRIKQLQNYDTSRLHEIKIPVLVMWGRYDDWIPLAAGEMLNAALPNSKIIIYENAGHVPMEDIPQETLKDFKMFINN